MRGPMTDVTWDTKSKRKGTAFRPRLSIYAVVCVDRRSSKVAQRL